MASFVHFVFLGLALIFAFANGQYTNGCGVALEDIPNPASDSCTAFFRCYRNRQYSLRCPLGQAFDFDRSRCRAAASVDCPLQLQRFQAPAVPSYLRPNQAQQDREIEIRVVHVPAQPAGQPGNVQFLANGQQVSGQPSGQVGQASQTPNNYQGQLADKFPVQTQPSQLGQQGQGFQNSGTGGQVQGQAPPQGQYQGQANVPIFVPNTAAGQQQQVQQQTKQQKKK